MNPSPLRTARRQRGLTLVEGLVVLAVTAVTLGAAVPSFEDLRQRRQLDGIAAQLENDLHMARTLAITQDRSMRVSFQRDAGGTCYIVHTGAANACTCNPDGTATCASGEAVQRSVRLRTSDAIQLHSNVPSILFDSAKGTSTPTGTLRLVGTEQRSVHLVVNIMGRVRACSPGGSLPGYKPC